MRSTGSFLLVCLLYAFPLFTPGACQRGGSFYPFVSVPTQPLAAPTTANKVYTTTVLLRTSVNYRDALFLQAARLFYNKTLSGFQTVEIVRAENRNTTQVQVTYAVTYNFITLRNSNKGYDANITSRIGRIQAVKTGLDSEASGSFLVDLSTFMFKGNSMCALANCQQGQYTYCEEITSGINVTCMSSCLVNFCLNDGWCHHSNGTVQPECSCNSSTVEWYIGRHCETYIHIWMPILILVVVLLLLGAIVLVGVYFLRHVIVRKLKPKPVKQEYKLKDFKPQKNVKNGAVSPPKTEDPLKRANEEALRQFKDSHEKNSGNKSDVSVTKEVTLLPIAHQPPKSSPPDSSSSTGDDDRRSSSSSSSNQEEPEDASFHASSTVDDVTNQDGSDATGDSDDIARHHYDTVELPRGFDWRDRVEPSSELETDPKYAIPNKKKQASESSQHPPPPPPPPPLHQDPMSGYVVSESMLI